MERQRMRDSFGRCGTTDVEADDEIDVEYDTSNPCGAIDELINGYSKWADKYIAACKGQKTNSHQEKRFERWNNMLDKGKGLNLKSKFIGIDRPTKFDFDTKIVNAGSSFRGSFGPLSTCGSIESTTILTTHPSLTYST